MNTGELIVELVLAGLLMLAALLFPAYNADLLPLNPSADIVGVSLALGFALGVVVDRSADTILDRWLGALRLKFALKEGVLVNARRSFRTPPSTTSSPRTACGSGSWRKATRGRCAPWRFCARASGLLATWWC